MNTPYRTVGIDPDTKDLSIAVWDGDGPQTALVVHVAGRGGEQSQVRLARALETTEPPYWGTIDVVAIEGQQIDGRRARTRDLFTLAHTTGAALFWTVHWLCPKRIRVPTPFEWKGSVAKHAMQARLYKALGWGYTIAGAGSNRYAQPVQVPENFQHITKGAWKHVGDALLLARWAYENK